MPDPIRKRARIRPGQPMRLIASDLPRGWLPLWLARSLLRELKTLTGLEIDLRSEEFRATGGLPR